MSKDNEEHFKRFTQKYVTITMKDKTVMNGYLIQGGGLMLLWLPGGNLNNPPEPLTSTDVESMTEWKRK